MRSRAFPGPAPGRIIPGIAGMAWRAAPLPLQSTIMRGAAAKEETIMIDADFPYAEPAAPAPEPAPARPLPAWYAEGARAAMKAYEELLSLLPQP